MDDAIRHYRIFVSPQLPAGMRLLAEQPTPLELEVGIVAAEIESTTPDIDRPGGLTSVSSDFELVYEPMEAELQRQVLLLASGVVLGIAGNLVVNGLTASRGNAGPQHQTVA